MKKILQRLDQFKRLLVEITCVVILILTVYQIVKTKLESMTGEGHWQQLEHK
jgi:hypothetical protein